MKFLKTHALWLALGASVVAGTSCSSQSPKPSQQAPAPRVDPSTLGTVTGKVASPVPGAVVTLAPREPASVSPPTAASPELDQIQMTFVPDTVLSQVGVPVSFRSSDTELHNINVRNSDTLAQEFNRSIIPGTSFEHAFEKAGFYDVRCDIHPAMTATIFVGTSPYAAVVGADGAFTIANVPPGSFTMTIYNGKDTQQQQVQVVAGVNTLPGAAS